MHPMQADCSPSEPKEHAAWCWAAGIPDPSPVRPAPIPLIAPQLAPAISEMLWDFGFRHHPDLQTKWIKGVAGLGMVAAFSDKPPAVEDDFSQAAKDFLEANNPEILDAVKNGSDEDREKVLRKLEKNFSDIQNMIEMLKEQ